MKSGGFHVDFSQKSGGFHVDFMKSRWISQNLVDFMQISCNLVDFMWISQNLADFMKSSGFHADFMWISMKSTWKPYKSNNSTKTLQFHGVQWEGYVSGFHEIRRISKGPIARNGKAYVYICFWFIIIVVVHNNM